MARDQLIDTLLYTQDSVGIRLLSERELEGPYPSWFTDEAVHLHNSHWARPQTDQQVADFVKGLSSDTSKLVFAVYELSEGQHIGNVSLQAINHLHQTAEMAFLFGNRQYWGKGLAKKASELVLRHAFRHLNLRRVYLGCLSSNQAMNGLAKSLGFQQEGVRRQALFAQGEFYDVVEYGLLKDEAPDYLNRQS